MKATDTSDLTGDQRARLAFALELIRATQGDVRGWSQHRIPADGTPHYLYLQRWRHGKIEQVYYVCQGEPQPSA